jgi:hypothetical protein
MREAEGRSYEFVRDVYASYPTLQMIRCQKTS